MIHYNEIFSSIEEFAEHVNINREYPISDLQPYITMAVDKYVRPYITDTTIEIALNDSDMKMALQRVIAPFAVMLATHEMSINFGTNGHTVSGSKTLLPASDTKIEMYMQSCKHRGFSALDSWLGEYIDFPTGNFLSGPADMEYLGIKLTPQNVTYMLIFQSASDITDYEISTLIPSDIFYLLEGGTVADDSQYKHLLRLIKKYVIKSAFMRLPDFGVLEITKIDKAQIAKDIEVLKEMIEIRVKKLTPQEPERTYNKIVSCIN